MGTTTHKGKGNGKRKGKPLTEKFVERATEPGTYSDGQHSGNGLMLRIQRSGSRQWIQRIVIHGKRRDIGLGGCSIVTLDEARAKARENRRIARAGGDPRTQVNPGVPTFADATKRVHAIHAASWKNDKQRAQWINEVSRIVWPTIGHLPIDSITTNQLTAVFEPIWLSKPVIASRVRQRTERIFDWAVSQDYRPNNPAGSPLKANLPKQPKGGHQKALHHSELPEAIRTVRNSTSNDSVKLACEFLALTIVRRKEGLGARWDEIDLDAQTWTVPASRMKVEGNGDHRVPLSTAAMNVLARCEKASGGRTGFVFPSPRSRAKPIDESTVNTMMRNNGIDASPHGFRSSFKGWAMEGAKNHLATEFAQAHKVKDKTEAAYSHTTDLFDMRRELMQEWGEYVTG